MISIIVCSANTELLNRLSININDTIGVKYELVVVDNRAHHWGISKAYNFSAAKAKFNVLCFVHEDVDFLTQNWGENVLKHIRSSNEIGVLGVAGSINKSMAVTSWWQPNFKYSTPKRMNIIQMYRKKNKNNTRFYLNPNDKLKERVVCLDGVFMVMRSEIWKKYKFDENLLNGFHGYDVDISLNTNKKHQNYVIFDVLLRHASEGVQSCEWFEDLIKVHYKYRKVLPIYSENLSVNEIESNENYLFAENLKFLKNYSFSNFSFEKVVTLTKLLRLYIYFKFKPKNGFKTSIFEQKK